MVLIADGGSTKCDWVLLDSKGEVVLKTRTLGLNPAVIPQEELYARIRDNKELADSFEKVEQVNFYGAGCGTKTPRQILENVISEIFPNAKVLVQEDMVAAVYAATTEPGIVCILGTGSNSCYFDGNEIHTKAPSLGFILMDEASGNYFGKRLIRDYFYNKMPAALAKSFGEKFDLDPDTIKMNLYKKPNPNTYLASFAEFIFTSASPTKGQEVNPYFYKLISEGILNFIEHRILCFEQAQNVPIHFIGSIAHFSEDIIRDCMKPFHLQLGNIVQRPIDGLIEYYQKRLIHNS